MTTQESIEKLKAMPQDGDEEILHGYADKILLRRLEALGEVDVAQAYKDARERVGFWYA